LCDKPLRRLPPATSSSSAQRSSPRQLRRVVRLAANPPQKGCAEVAVARHGFSIRSEYVAAHAAGNPQAGASVAAAKFAHEQRSWGRVRGCRPSPSAKP
jgi:hypothetical protein